MDDHLVALNARLAPLKSIGTNLLDAAIRAGHVLYPELTGPATVPELSRILLASEERLRVWRSSSARAGADRALSFVLALYEEIDISSVRSLRIQSKWLTDPEMIKMREEAADYFAEWAVTKYINPGRVYQDGEDDDVAEDDGGEESSGEENDDAESSSEAQDAGSGDEETAAQTETQAPEADVNATAEVADTETSAAEATEARAEATAEATAETAPAGTATTAADISVEPSSATAVPPSASAASDAAA